MTRVYESNGPDVKIRGTASHVAEKYVQLARDAQTSSDPVGAENYFQHAEHYFRLIASMQEQFRSSAPHYRPDGDQRDESYGDSEDDGGDQRAGGGEPSYAPREPHAPRESHGYANRDQQSHGNRERPPHSDRESHPYGLREPQPFTARQAETVQPAGDQPADVERLPNFITAPTQPQPPAPQPQSQNGHDGQSEGFPLHRRRRRRHGPRGDTPSAAADDTAAETGPPPAGE